MVLYYDSNDLLEMRMTPRERFITALSGGMPDRIPMVIWNNKLPGHGIEEIS
jgi:hypothetical protein